MTPREVERVLEWVAVGLIVLAVLVSVGWIGLVLVGWALNA